MSFASLLCVRCASAPIGWFFWNFRTEFEPHWSFLEAWERGWFPRNVSDLAAIEKLKICDEGAKPLKPTASPYWARDGGALEGGKKEPWVVHNAFPLVVGAVVGALGVFALGWAVAAMRGKASTEPSASDYVAMGQ